MNKEILEEVKVKLDSILEHVYSCQGLIGHHTATAPIVSKVHEIKNILSSVARVEDWVSVGESREFEHEHWVMRSDKKITRASKDVKGWYILFNRCGKPEISHLDPQPTHFCKIVKPQPPTDKESES